MYGVAKYVGEISVLLGGKITSSLILD